MVSALLSDMTVRPNAHTDQPLASRAGIQRRVPLCVRCGRQPLIGAAHHLSLHATPAGTLYCGFKRAIINVRLSRRLAPRREAGFRLRPASGRVAVGSIAQAPFRYRMRALRRQR